jgi:hypothetical protein
MKKYILVLLVFITSIGYSQTKKELLAQKWKLDKVEEFGQEYSLLENQKSDFLNFTSNGEFIGIIEGNHVEGRWESKGNNITLSVNKQLSKTKINWTKVKIIEKEKFALEYQNGDLITATLVFVPYK